MSSKFKIVGIFGRVKNSLVKETLKALISYLQNLQQDIVIDSETALALDDLSLNRLPAKELGERCDLVIVVGGDGSLLHAAHTVITNETPVLGINRGRLGFLTDILPKELHKVKTILEGNFTLEKRFLLTARIEHENHIVGTGNALNEVALIPDSVPHMNEFEIYINGQFVCSQDSDGVIIATPTGSTAYALSGGGPILHPQLDAIVIVPMFPHTLSLRPIVIEGNHEIMIHISPNNTATPRLSCDSHTFIHTQPGSRIYIRKRLEHLMLVHPNDYDYYASLRSKLHWGRKLHYSE